MKKSEYRQEKIKQLVLKNKYLSDIVFELAKLNIKIEELEQTIILKN